MTLKTQVEEDNNNIGQKKELATEITKWLNGVYEFLQNVK